MTATTPSEARTRGWTAAWAGAIHFEWTKLASVRSTWVLLIATVVLTAAGSWLIGASAKASGENGFDTAMPAPYIAFQVIAVAQVAPLLVAAFAITSEYSTASILSTLRSVPSRGRVLASKAAVLAVLSGLAGIILMAVGTGVASVFAGDFGTFTGEQYLHATIGASAELAFVSVLVLGIGAAVRSTAATIIATFAILFGLPFLLPIFQQEWVRNLADYLPTRAGEALVTGQTDPYGWVIAVLVLAAWAVIGTLAGYTVMRARNA